MRQPRAQRSAKVLPGLARRSPSELPGLQAALKLARLDHPGGRGLAEALSGGPPLQLLKNAKADDVASLIFTSGTTGKPKGVMLSHRNFTSLVAKLAGVFPLEPGDGVLCVLPLHHTFEFTVRPAPAALARRADHLPRRAQRRSPRRRARERQHHRHGRRAGALAAAAAARSTAGAGGQAGASVEQVEQGADRRQRRAAQPASTCNLGKLLFWPVHRKLGGQLRLLISGGSALPPEDHEALPRPRLQPLRGLRPHRGVAGAHGDARADKRIAGTVGAPLPGHRRADRPARRPRRRRGGRARART